MPDTNTATPAEPTHRFRSSFEKTAADRMALTPDGLYPINLDIQAVVTGVIGTIAAFTKLRDNIVAELPRLDATQLDKLEAYAEALAYAQTAYLAASEPAEALPPLAERATSLRDLLLSDATALARRGLVDGKRLTELKGGPGYLNIASDVGVLVRILRERWADIATKSAIQSSELDDAEQIFEHITLAYAERSRQSQTAVAATEDRQRAYTLVVKTYDQARRAATYLRWNEGDADKFVPSLWAGRGGRGSPTTTPPANGQPAATGPAATTPATPSAPTHPAVPAAPPLAPGLPGGSPFVTG